MANTNEFMLNIIAALNKQLSKAQLKNDLKGIDNSLSVKVIAKLATSLSKRQLGKNLKQLNNLYVQVGTKFKTDKNQKNKLLNEIKQLQKNLTELQLKVGVAKSASTNTIKSVISTVRTAQEYADKTSITLNIETRKEKAINDIIYIGQKYSKLFSNVSASQKYDKLLNSAYSISDKSQLQEVRAEISAFTSELKANGLAAESTGDKWKRLTERARDLFSAASIVRVVFTQVRQAISTTIGLDKVYTDLVKVNSELNRNDYADYLERCNKKAKELATTQKALIEGATEFSKSGYFLDTSNKLTEKSTILSNVGDMSASDSAKAIISGVQAYDVVDGYTDVVDKAQALIDKYNEIGNTASITTAEIAQGVQSVGSVFSDANTSVDEFIALLAAGNRQYQDSDALALGLRTSALRIRGCKTELEAMGEETDTVVTSTAKLEEQIKALTNIDGSGGVEILEADKETFRSIYDIYVDIGKVYKDMSDTDQSALLELIAGKNRASAISATLNNMSEAEEILQNSLNAAGSAQEEYDEYLQSTEAHITRFQATLVETYSTFLNGDMISHVADIGTATLNLVNNTDLLKHSILAVLALNIGKGITTVGAVIASTAKQMNILGNAIQQVKSLESSNVLKAEVLNEVGIAAKSLTEKNLKLLLSQQQLDESDRIRILRIQGLAEKEAIEKLTKMGLTTATNAQTAANTAEAASTVTLSGALTTLKTAAIGAGTAIKTMIASNPLGFALTLITTAASVVASAINKHNQALEEARQKNIDAANSAAEEAQNLRELYSEYQRLAGIQDKTTSQEEKFKTAVENITTALGDKAETLEGLTAGTDEYTEALKKATQAELENQYTTSVQGRKSAEEELENSQSSLSGLAKKASDVALAIANAAKGIQTGNTDAIYTGKGGTGSTAISKVKTVGKFSPTTNAYINGTLRFDEYKNALSVDISNYENAISNIDAQIDVLKNLQSTFEDTVNSANGGIGGHNYADKIKDLEKEKDKINNVLDDAKSGASSTKDEYQELFDFFEQGIKVLDDALSLLKSNLENVTGSFAKNQILDAEVNLNAEKINNYTDALAMYTQKANEALSSIPNDIAQKIKDGAVDLTTFIGEGNESVVDAVKDYQNWADKVADCKQELSELKETIRQLELDKFNNIVEDFTNQFDLRSDANSLIDKQISLLEEVGQLIGESFYTAQIDQAKKQLGILEEEKAKLVEQMTSAISSGRVNLCPAA